MKPPHGLVHSHIYTHLIGKLMSYKLSAATLAAIAVCSAATAADSEPSIFSFSGYGTLSAVHSSEPQADYMASPTRPNGAGFSRDWSPDVDSRLAAQLSAEFNSQWSAVVQVISEQRWDNSYTPKLEWANVQYAPTPDFTVRIGRIALPTFLASNSQKVGYTLPWVRVPNTAYNALPISNSDGVDASYSFRVGQAKNTVLLHAGTKRNRVGLGESPLAGRLIHLTKMYGVVDVLKWGATTVQVSHVKSLMEIETIPRQQYKLSAIGATYDPGQWFATGELNKTTLALTGDIVNWYVGGGYRVNDFTPYLMYSQRRVQGGGFSVTPAEKSTAAGVRWDFMKNVDLKLQYDSNKHPPGSWGILNNLQPGYRPGGGYHVVSAAIDFVF